LVHAETRRRGGAVRVKGASRALEAGDAKSPLRGVIPSLQQFSGECHLARTLRVSASLRAPIAISACAISTFAVEKRGGSDHNPVAAAERLPLCISRKTIMRIAETAAVGLIAVAAQILIAATVLI